MFDDPRWGSDPRERDDDARDRDPVDPRDAFVDTLDLPRSLEREMVRDPHDSIDARTFRYQADAAISEHHR